MKKNKSFIILFYPLIYIYINTCIVNIGNKQNEWKFNVQLKLFLFFFLYSTLFKRRQKLLIVPFFNRINEIEMKG